MEPIRILIADDQDVAISGLKRWLEDAEDIEVIGTAKNGQEAVEQARLLFPDIIILDWSMPKINGIEATRIIKNDIPQTKILLFSEYYKHTLVDSAIRAGASGYLAKIDIDANKFQVIIRVIATGGIVISEHAKEGLMSPGSFEDILQSFATKYKLTLRETEVLRHVADRKTNPEIAAVLSISIVTVSTHLTSIYSKVGFIIPREIKASEARKRLINMINGTDYELEDVIQ